MENHASSLTCSLVIDQFAHFALHDGERFPRLLLHQQPQLPQVGKGEQVVHTIALERNITSGQQPPHWLDW